MPRTQATRQRVLELVAELDESAVPVTLSALSDRLDLPTSTVRYHLNRLVADATLERVPLELSTPGRRPMVYRRTATAPTSGEVNYRLLAEILSSALMDRVEDAPAACEAAGEAWGSTLGSAQGARPARREDHGLRRLRDHLSELGFRPEVVGPEEIRLHNCPFRSVAESRREVACRVHLGLMKGLLAADDSGVGVEELIPFADPDYCTVRLSRRQGR